MNGVLGFLSYQKKNCILKVLFRFYFKEIVRQTFRSFRNLIASLLLLISQSLVKSLSKTSFIRFINTVFRLNRNITINKSKSLSGVKKIRQLTHRSFYSWRISLLGPYLGFVFRCYRRRWGIHFGIFVNCFEGTRLSPLSLVTYEWFGWKRYLMLILIYFQRID